MLGKQPLAGQVQSCETRLALSASIVGELLVEAIGLDVELEDTSQQPNLVAQAEQLRAETGLDGSGQTIAVIDSGIAWDHNAFGSGFGPGYRVVGGWDIAENDDLPYDDGPSGYHGTHVAGLLAGEGIGVAPGADLVSLRVFDDNGFGKLEWIEQALQWVHENQDAFASPITTVNLSIGAAVTEENLLTAQDVLSDELAALAEDQILVFAAAGNNYGNTGQSEVLYPASDPNVIPVASIGDDGLLSEFSQRSNNILAAQGEGIRSAVPEHVFGWDGSFDDTRELDGSSMATPQVAAASVLVRQALINEGLEATPERILERLSLTSQVDQQSGFQYQVVDLHEAVSFVQPTDQLEDTGTDQFLGTTAGDQIQLDLREGIQITADGVTTTLEQIDPQTPIRIDAGAGADMIEILGSDSAERLIARPDQGLSTLTTNEYAIDLLNFENIRFAGGGGLDRATLFDSSSDDTLQSSVDEVELSGVGFQYEVIGVSRVFVHATGGGSDTAFLNDSVGDDHLVVRPQFASLRGEDAFRLAYGFERVYAYAGAGGNDVAEIYDSAANDTLSISASRTSISSQGYFASARGFSSVEAHAVAGGDDIASLYSDETDSQWRATDDMVQLTDQDGKVRIARAFEEVRGFEQFEPIDLFRHRVDLNPLDIDDSEERARLEAEAMRSIFDRLGE